MLNLIFVKFEKIKFANFYRQEYFSNAVDGDGCLAASKNIKKHHVEIITPKMHAQCHKRPDEQLCWCICLVYGDLLA